MNETDKIIYDESAKLVIEEYKDKLSKHEMRQIYSHIIQKKLLSWNRGFKRSNEYKNGGTKQEYFDYRIREYIDGYLKKNNNNFESVS